MASVHDLAADLNVPMGAVIKALMTIGVVRTATEELPSEDVEHVRKILAASVPAAA